MHDFGGIEDEIFQESPVEPKEAPDEELESGDDTNDPADGESPELAFDFVDESHGGGVRPSGGGFALFEYDGGRSFRPSFLLHAQPNLFEFRGGGDLDARAGGVLSFQAESARETGLQVSVGVEGAEDVPCELDVRRERRVLSGKGTGEDDIDLDVRATVAVEFRQAYELERSLAGRGLELGAEDGTDRFRASLPSLVEVEVFRGKALVLKILDFCKLRECCLSGFVGGGTFNLESPIVLVVRFPDQCFSMQRAFYFFDRGFGAGLDTHLDGHFFDQNTPLSVLEFLNHELLVIDDRDRALRGCAASGGDAGIYKFQRTVKPVNVARRAVTLADEGDGDGSA